MEFKATGKQILEAGWRAVYGKESTGEEDDEKEKTQILPEFTQGEKGPHEIFLSEGKTSAPKAFTEATLLRAMETAGKQVEDEELRDLMKDNGIGRPSTRAAIIETLFRRNYIRRERKNIVPTITGMELIRVINNELLKSAEMTGNWEFKLRQIEKGNYQAEEFLREMKQMVSDLVVQVRSENVQRITIASASAAPEKKKDAIVCPKCGQGTMLKGKAAFGCSNFKNGCDMKVPFELMGKKLTEAQIKTLLDRKKTAVIKGFSTGGGKKDGILKLTGSFNVEFEETTKAKIPKKKQEGTPPAVCPKCKKGTVLKGRAAYGCSEYKNGCDFRLPFENLSAQ
jgi:DNA topoisomerase-3